MRRLLVEVYHHGCSRYYHIYRVLRGYEYGTSEGLFAGAGAHATWIAAKDDQNEEYYRRPMSAAEILSTVGHDAGEMGRRHEEIFRLHEALEAAERGAGGGAYERSRSAFNKAGSAEARGTPF